MYPPKPPEVFFLSGCRACEVILAKRNSAGLALGLGGWGGDFFLGAEQAPVNSAEQALVGGAEQAPGRRC